MEDVFPIVPTGFGKSLNLSTLSASNVLDDNVSTITVICLVLFSRG